MVDTHLYAAPDDSFPALFPDHFPTRIPHGPPYDQEFADGLVITGFPEKDVFSVSDFTAPSAVHLGFVLVPTSNAATGSSVDFDSGPIIPNDILPIAVQGDVFLNGVLFEQNAFGFNLTSAADVDGRSHFLVETYENSAFAPPGLDSLVGDYEYRLTLRDVNGAGFNVVVQFAAVPEPGMLPQFALLGAVLWASCVRRRGLHTLAPCAA